MRPLTFTVPAVAVAVVLGCSRASLTAQAPGPPPNRTLTAIAGLRVGHFTLSERPTGCTVVVADPDVIAGVDVRGAAPGTRDTELLSPVNSVERVHAIVLAGGSAFGLDAASGVMRWLEEHGRGFTFGGARIPIAPAAILFDLGVGDPKIRPTADCGYRAAEAASTAPVTDGSVGAGAGATVGKLHGMEHAMKGGIGSAAITLPGGLTIAALVAVNAAGDVIDPANGRVVAGVRGSDGRTLVDARKLLRAGALQPPRAGSNTTLAVVATNAHLTKTQATRLAQMAHDGFSRAISPVHTSVDGDTAFVLATGTQAGDVNMFLLGSLAAEVTADAIVRAVHAATGLPGLPSVRDLGH
jgi:L-aminopeptidase/D-esterase-like protein